ncbi:hypothetical protein [Phocaeicola faecalis]
MNKEKRIQTYALYFAQAIEDVVRDEDNEYHIEVDNNNVTDIMTGLIIGTGLAFNRMTGREDNMLEFTHTANRLIVQYLMDAGTLSKENESTL